MSAPGEDPVTQQLIKRTDEDNPPIMVHFEFSHLPPHLQEISSYFASIAWKMVEELEPGAERSAGLRKLLEAKDCCVRQRVLDSRG